MFHLANAVFLAGAFALIFGVGLVVKALLGNRKRDLARYRYFSGPEYNRDLLQQSAFSETEDWLADRRANFEPFCLLDPGVDERRAATSRASRRNPESN
jgi:hypothetical protein